MFIFFPSGVDRKIYSKPVVTYSLISINILVFLIQFIALPMMSGVDSIFSFGDSVMKFADTFGVHPDFQPIWGLFTYMFLHGGLLHLVFNMLYLYLVGVVVEDHIGSRRMLLFYLLGGVFSAVFHCFVSGLTSDFTGPLVGASGAIAVLMGVMVVVLPWTDFKISYFYWFFFIFPGSGTWKVPTVFFLLFYFFISNFFSGLLSLGGSGGGVAYWAHIGGFVFGFLGAGMLYSFKAFGKTEAEMMYEETEVNRALRRSLRQGARDVMQVDSSADTSHGSIPTTAVLARLVQLSNAEEAWRAYRAILHEDPGFVLPVAEQYSMLKQFIRQDMPEAVFATVDHLLDAYDQDPHAREALIIAGEFTSGYPAHRNRAMDYFNRLLRLDCSRSQQEKANEMLKRIQADMNLIDTDSFEYKSLEPKDLEAGPSYQDRELELQRLERKQGVDAPISFGEELKSVPSAFSPSPDKVSPLVQPLQPRVKSMEVQPLSVSLSRSLDDTSSEVNVAEPSIREQKAITRAAEYMNNPEDSIHIESHDISASKPITSPCIIHPDSQCSLVLTPRKRVDYNKLLKFMVSITKEKPDSIARRMKIQSGIVISQVSYAKGEKIRNSMRRSGISVHLVENRSEWDMSEVLEVKSMIVREDKWLWRLNDVDIETSPMAVQMLGCGRVRVVPGSPVASRVLDFMMLQPKLHLRISDDSFEYWKTLGIPGFPIDREDVDKADLIQKLAESLSAQTPLATQTYCMRQLLDSSSEKSMRLFKSVEGYDYYNRWHMQTHLLPEAE